MKLQCVLLALIGAIFPVTPYKILLISPMATRSHINVFKALVMGLIEAGHEVTHLSPFPKSSKDPSGYKVIPSTLHESDIAGIGGQMWSQEGSSVGVFRLVLKGLALSEKMCYDDLKLPEMQPYLEGTAQVDLVIQSLFFHDCFLPISAVNNVPYIYISPSGLSPSHAPFLDTRWSPSYVPAIMLPFTDEMTFFQRVINAVFGYWAVDISGYFFIDPTHQRAIDANFKEKLNEMGMESSLGSLRMNASMVILNNDLSSESPRPYSPTVIRAGGMHCRPAKELPEDLEEWVTGSKNGFIYFSLGSTVQGKLMPEKFRKMFIEAFARLPEYNVLWKWETEEMEGLPKNVKLSKWLPQQDLLGHEEIRLFITQGGLMSTQEAAYHGVPIVGIPIGADQMFNMKKTEMEGAGITLEWSNLSSEAIYDGVRRVLDDPSFKENLRRRSAIMRDQPETPLERAVFWTEYVIRHKGAHHLRSASRELTWYQYHLIDVWLFIGLVLSVLIFGITYVLRLCFRRIFCTKTEDIRIKKD